jgi:hypothetical protein
LSIYARKHTKTNIELAKNDEIENRRVFENFNKLKSGFGIQISIIVTTTVVTKQKERDVSIFTLPFIAI